MKFPGNPWGPRTIYRHSVAFSHTPVNVITWDRPPLNDWNVSVLRSYVQEDVVPRAIVSFAFLAVAVLFVLIFIAWRFLRCSAIVCCNRCRGSSIAHDVLKGRCVKWTKVRARHRTISQV